MGRRTLDARADARTAGARTYQGFPCKLAGHTLRHTSSGACVACQADAQRQRRGTPARLPSLDDVLG